ncbi:hypothetical protein A143_09310 [Vibrio splendidus ZS-139]|nr:hypothetical protein A143_09310 [Vibrio splendidus ZS-139]
MISKIKVFAVKSCHFVKRHYLFVLAIFFILLGLDLIDSRFWGYKSSDAEIIGGNIRAGLKIVAGAMLLGFSLISLTLHSKK